MVPNGNLAAVVRAAHIAQKARRLFLTAKPGHKSRSRHDAIQKDYINHILDCVVCVCVC